MLTQSDLRSIQIRGNDCVTTAPLQVLPSLTIAADTRGTLISTNPPVVTWQTPTNAWQALLGVMKLLDEEVRVCNNYYYIIGIFIIIFVMQVFLNVCLGWHKQTGKQNNKKMLNKTVFL